MRNYVGITIGPIFDTICDASSPAALWFSSSLFSDITKRICEALQGSEGFEGVKIYSPYYSDTITMDDGVGKFHDRIIFSAQNFSHEKMKSIITQVKRETVRELPETFQDKDAEEFFLEYLQIHYIAKEEQQMGDKNCVLVLSPYLDELELMKSFPKTDVLNPIRKMFLGEKNNRNKYIKDVLDKKVRKESNQFRNVDGSIWTIEEIASCHNRIMEPLKRKHYYAVVSADGDAMGSFLKQIASEQVTEFSKVCLEYDEAAAALIGQYGGMTIYAGGDDLLFLAPIQNETSTVFELCHNIQKLFRDKIRQCDTFKNIEKIPTISFGISIQYAKFPLYEALESSRRLLALAKKDGDFNKADKECHKNNMLIELQKHSGQSVSILVSNQNYDILESFLELGKGSATEEQLQSVLYTLQQFHTLIATLNRNVREYECYLAAWNNLFDNAGQTQAKNYIEAVCNTYYHKLVLPEELGVLVPAQISSLYHDEDAQSLDVSLQTLLQLLRLKKFMTEKEGNE